MSSGIYAIANIGYLRLYIGEANRLQEKWRPLLDQLNRGIHPHLALQAVWNKEGNQRRFSFHTWQEIADDPEIIGIEQLTQGK